MTADKQCLCAADVGGKYTATLSGDCDDAKAVVNPFVADICGNSVDDNCDGKTDETCNAVGCGADGVACGSGKGACSSGHCMYTDAKGYKWTLVPAGTFWMGCNAAVDAECDPNESPQHLVDMSPYWVGVYEVTASNYKGCVDGLGAGCTVPGGGTYATWNVGGKEQHPVNYVNWAQSQSYCKWLGGDLPTEAQWEKAARGGCELYGGEICAASEPKYPWGNAAPVCGQNAVFAVAPGTCGAASSTYAVGAGSAQGASPYGAYDMAGNIDEWTLDWYNSVFYGKPEATVKDAVNAAGVSYRVLRGASYASGLSSLRSGYRYYYDPTFSAGHVFGLRCAKPFP